MDLPLNLRYLELQKEEKTYRETWAQKRTLGQIIPDLKELAKCYATLALKADEVHSPLAHTIHERAKSLEAEAEDNASGC